MRVVIQRTKKASVHINDILHSQIAEGLLILIGVAETDNTNDIDWLVHKIVQLRIFADEQGRMNKSIMDSGGDILLVSQFTLLASTHKGNRPSFIRSAAPDKANLLYMQFITQLEKKLCKPIQTGVFGADMQVSLINDGPVTIIIDSHLRE